MNLVERGAKGVCSFRLVSKFYRKLDIPTGKGFVRSARAYTDVEWSVFNKSKEHVETREQVQSNVEKAAGYD